MKSPLISIIVPSYNEEKYLRNCLRRLRKQTYPNFEIIVINNRSTDRTGLIAEKYADKVVYEPVQGLIPARQRGFVEAKGEIIARTDADCLPRNDWLEKVYEKLSSNQNLVAVFGPVKFVDKGIILEHLSLLSTYLLIYFTRIFMGHWQLVGGNHAIKAEVARKVKPHLKDKQVHEDIDLSCHVVEYGKIAFLPSMIIKTSARRFDQNIFFIFEYLLRLLKTLLMHHPSHKLHKVS